MQIHIKHAQTLAELAVIYCASERTLKSWVARGKAVGDLPPLDEPTAMASWWRRNQSYRVPDALATLETVPPPAEAAEAATPAATEGASPLPPEEQAPPPAPPPPGTPAQILQAATAFVVVAQAKLTEAIKTGDVLRHAHCSRALNHALDVLTKARANFEAAQKNDATVVTQGVIDEQIGQFLGRLAELLSELVRSLVNDALSIAAARDCSAREFKRTRLAIANAAPFFAAAALAHARRVICCFKLVCPEMLESARRFVVEFTNQVDSEGELKRRARQIASADHAES